MADITNANETPKTFLEKVLALLKDADEQALAESAHAPAAAPAPVETPAPEVPAGAVPLDALATFREHNAGDIPPGKTVTGEWKGCQCATCRAVLGLEAK